MPIVHAAAAALLAFAGASSALGQVQIIWPDRCMETYSEVLRSDFTTSSDEDFVCNPAPGPWTRAIESRVNTGPSFVRATASQDSSWDTAMLHAHGVVGASITLGAPDRDAFVFGGSLLIVLLIVEEPVTYRLTGQSTISSLDALACFYIEGDVLVTEHLDNTGPVDETGVLAPGEYDLAIDVCLFAERSGEATYDWTITFAPVAPAGCPGDANGDEAVDFADLNLLLDHWGQATGAGAEGDVDGSGVVDFADLNLLLDHWGETCADPAA